MIRGFSHMQLVVTDVSASARWYCEVLGLVQFVAGEHVRGHREQGLAAFAETFRRRRRQRGRLSGGDQVRRYQVRGHIARELAQRRIGDAERVAHEYLGCCGGTIGDVVRGFALDCRGRAVRLSEFLTKIPRKVRFAITSRAQVLESGSLLIPGTAYASVWRDEDGSA